MSRFLVPAGLLLLTFALMMGLWAYRTPSTTISVVALTSDLELASVSPQPVTQPFALKSLGATGARRVEFPPDLMIASSTTNEFVSGMQLALTEPGNGSITLARLAVPEGARLAIHKDSEGAFRLVVDGASGHEYKVEVTIEGSLLVGPIGGQAKLVSAAAPKLVTITFADAPAELDFVLQSPAHRALTSNLPVGAIGLSRVETVGSDLAAQRISGIASGELILHDLEDKVVPIRSGNDLTLSVEDGELRSVALSDDGINVHFTGKVGDIRGGSRRHPVALMPTALEWLMANQRLVFILSVIAYLFGGGLAAIRWWKGGEL